MMHPMLILFYVMRSAVASASLEVGDSVAD